MDLEREGRRLALAFLNIDDLVLAREVSGSGMNLLSLSGRSLVGSAVFGAGLATRAAVLGAQVATKSALAVAAAAKGRIPGAAAAEQMVYELDQRVGRGGETASFVASQGVALAKPDRRPPAEPIFGDPWLGKRLKPSATPNTVLADSTVDLACLAALPLALGTSALMKAIASPGGQQVTRAFWDAVSSLVDSVSGRAARGAASSQDRAERRAVIMMVGLTPLIAAAQDVITFSEALSRASAGDVEKLRGALTTALERIGADPNDRHTPVRLLSVLEDGPAGEPGRIAGVGRAVVEDSAALTRLVVAYTNLIAGLVATSLQSTVRGALDVDGIEAWVRDDEASRAAGGPGLPERCPASVRQLETLVAAFSRGGNGARGFAVPSAIELARDTIFTYSTRALGREGALLRMERLFGAAVRDRLADDCSLRGEFLDAASERDARLAALVSTLRSEGTARLRRAREHAAGRLASLTSSGADAVLERMAPQRVGDRVAVLQRFISLADTAAALDGVSSQEASRQKVLARFSDWMSTPAADAQPA